MTRWSIAETKAQVARVHGETHLARIASSLYAMAERQRYARFHFQEVQRLVTIFQEQFLQDNILFAISHGPNEDEREAFDGLMLQTGAHALACVLSIHAIADVTAFAVYWALGYDRLGMGLRERAVSASSIQPLLRSSASHIPIANVLETLTSEPAYQHVVALANHSKHRGLVRPLLNEDWTGTREHRHELRFASFSYDGVQYPEGELSAILAPAYELASSTVVEVGNSINALLAEQAD